MHNLDMIIKKEGSRNDVIRKAKKYLTEQGYADHVIELEESSATVQLAAEALDVEPGMIAKTMSFLTEDGPILILTEGTAKIANRKYKDYFHEKAKMIPFDEVEDYIGHAPGGVCPFGIRDGVKVYLDESLKRYDTVYPAAGNDHSAVKLTIVELEEGEGRRSGFFLNIKTERKRTKQPRRGVFMGTKYQKFFYGGREITIWMALTFPPIFTK